MRAANVSLHAIPMPGIVSDSSAFPFVFVRYAPENATDAEVRDFIADQRRILHMKRRFILLVDATRPTSSSSTHRRMYADWMKEAEELSRLYCAGIVLVVSNPVMRGAMQAVLWFFTPPMPIVMVGTLEEAARRTTDMMRKEGMANADAPERIVKRRVA